MNEIGVRIKRRREELQLTQEELARRVGYKSKSAIQKIERGVNELRQEKIAIFAQALSTTPAYLMGWTEEKAPKLTLEELNILLAYREAEDVKKDIICDILKVKRRESKETKQ